MRIVTTTEDFIHYLKTDKERIKAIRDAGFSYVDLSMFQWKPDSLYLKDGWEEEVYSLKEYANSIGLQFAQAHAQGGNALSKDPEAALFIKKATLRAIEVCSILGVKNLVAHAGYNPDFTKKDWFVNNKEYYTTYFDQMEKFGVNLLTENSNKFNVPNAYNANNGEDLFEFCEYVNHPLFHVCWDTGHANIEGSQYNEIVKLGKHLKAIHYNDNNGVEDEHRAPFMGTLNHDEVMNALLEIGYNGDFTLECSSSILKFDNWIKKRRIFAKDTRAFDPPVKMQISMGKFLYDTAKYILNLYGIEGE